MSTKKSKTRSVIAEFQAVVDELRSRGMTDVDVHSLVNMIWQGWLVGGQPTQAYLDMAAAALAQRSEPDAGTIVNVRGDTFN